MEISSELGFHNITCPECGHEGNPVIKRKVEGFAAVFEFGIRCGKCLKWSHSFFANSNVIRLRQQWDKVILVLSENPSPELERIARQRKMLFQRAYNRVNANMRKATGMEKPDDQQHTV